MSGEEAKDTGDLDRIALNKFSRQNATFGAETTAKLIKMRVIIYGLRGVGAETAKNLALQGTGAITLVDSAPVTAQDLGLNFFFTEADIGSNRAESFAPKLRDLNPVCDIKVATEVDEALISGHTALVVCNSDVRLSDLKRLNAMCRNAEKSFLYAFTGGVSSSIFVDHGDKHVVHDPDGEKVQQKLISDISPSENANEYIIRYETPEGQVATAIDGGHYKISDIRGCDALNGQVVEVSHPYKDPVRTVRTTFKGVTSLDSYVAGGIMTEEKVPRAYPMSSLESKIKNPGSPFTNDMVMSDLLNFSEQQVHVALVASLTFAEKTGRLPGSADVLEVIETAKALIAAKDIDLEDFTVDEEVCKKVASYASVELQPMAAFLGGVLGQEVVKCTGKFTPIPGWFHFSAFETLPAEAPADTAPRGSRYDNVAAVFGWEFVEKLGNLRYFMVGCGALGCEFLKNFAMNGVCCGPDGLLVVTDADRIELSNLTRQFLFREHNVGQPKSKAGCAMAVQMNKDFKVNALEHFVGRDTEHIFDDPFWMGLSGVCNALDNMEARNYVDAQCVKYEKSLLESGTMGTSGNVDTIKPHSTRTYREGGAAAQGGGVPMCTLRNFPHLTDHCIEWARDQFELLFVKLPKNAGKYVEDRAAFEYDKRGLEPTQAIFETRCVISMLKAAKNPTLTGAAQLAFDLFHMLFRDKIQDLQSAYPPDSRTKDKNGNDLGPFWSEKKRYPQVAIFNPDDEAHWNFMSSATCLFGVVLGVLPARNENDATWLEDFRSSEWVKSLLGSLEVPSYIKSPVKVEGEDEAPEQDVESPIEVLLAEAAALSDGITLRDLETHDFEKDDDLNFHIAFVTATANVRCDNYSIKRTDFDSCKVIAGKIIAAIATTTAAVCGLVILELFKVLQDKGTDDLMNRLIGLAVNAYTSFTQEPPRKFNSFEETKEPDPAELEGMDAYDEKGILKPEFIVKTQQKAYPEGHSVWDKLTCDGNLTLNEFAQWFKTEHNIIMKSWNIIVGYNDQKEPVSCSVFPPPPVLDYSLLPPVDAPMGEAMKTLMKLPNSQQYMNLWRKFKAEGSIPAQSTEAGKDVVTGDTTLKNILRMMEVKADALLGEGKIDQKSISNIDKRAFWLVTSDQTPQCETPDFDEVATLAAIKINL
jgi:ubiquitin-activating enzyme E1